MGSIREAKIMVKENPIHKQQIDPILMSERFPYYDLDGHLAACGAEIHQIIAGREDRSEEHTSELQSLMRISYAVFCLKKKIHSSDTKKHDKKRIKSH